MFLIDRLTSKFKLPDAASALPGRDNELPTAKNHFINGNPLKAPYPENMQSIVFGLGCFWGAERIFWNLEGVYVTAVGYFVRRHQKPDLSGSMHRTNRPQ